MSRIGIGTAHWQAYFQDNQAALERYLPAALRWAWDPHERDRRRQEYHLRLCITLRRAAQRGTLGELNPRWLAWDAYRQSIRRCKGRERCRPTARGAGPGNLKPTQPSPDRAEVDLGQLPAAPGCNPADQVASREILHRLLTDNGPIVLAALSALARGESRIEAARLAGKPVQWLYHVLKRLRAERKRLEGD